MTGARMYFDREGNEIISTLAWAVKFETEDRCLRETHLPNGYRISTIWLGLNMNPFDGPPVIFESMVFRDCRDFGGEDYDQVRYSTKEEALRSHDELVHRWSMKKRRKPKVYQRNPYGLHASRRIRGRQQRSRYTASHMRVVT